MVLWNRASRKRFREKWKVCLAAGDWSPSPSTSVSEPARMEPPFLLGTLLAAREAVPCAAKFP